MIRIALSIVIGWTIGHVIEGVIWPNGAPDHWDIAVNIGVGLATYKVLG